MPNLVYILCRLLLIRAHLKINIYLLIYKSFSIQIQNPKDKSIFSDISDTYYEILIKRIQSVKLTTLFIILQNFKI